MNDKKKIESRIGLYFHCRSCTSGSLAVGWTKEGIQVYCENCELSVEDIDFKGQKLSYYESKCKTKRK